MTQGDVKRASIERKRALLYLINQYLMDNGLKETASTLQEEAEMHMDYEVCDNVDLDTIYLEFSSYFQLKFSKPPRVLRKLEASERPKKAVPAKKKKQKVLEPNPTPGGNSDNKNDKYSEGDGIAQSLTVKPLLTNYEAENFEVSTRCRSLQEYEHFNPEWAELADVIFRDIVKKDFGVRWRDVYGNSTVARIIREAVVLPLEQPEVFTSDLKPWKSVLLHGPPGTGKTFIAKVLCSETFDKVTFFNVSPSTIISKWRGDSEKLIKVLFDVAKFCSPSVIFIDEIESLTSRRDTVSEHEASRRFKNELLSLMDGIGKDNEGVFLLANTNLPWEIDAAFLRRFERRVIIDLPNHGERISMLKSNIQSPLSDDMLNELAVISDGLTGDEIRVACKEFAMKQMRKSLSAQQNKSAGATNALATELLESLKQIKPLGRSLLKKYTEWHEQYGNNNF